MRARSVPLSVRAQVPRHPGFRLVAAMNPATDAGKHELPAALRNRFTEVWVPEPSQRSDLQALAAAYLAGLGGPAPPVDAAVDCYRSAKQEAVRAGRRSDDLGHAHVVPCERVVAGREGAAARDGCRGGGRVHA